MRMIPVRVRPALIVVTAVAGVVLATAPLSAQIFGSNQRSPLADLFNQGGQQDVSGEFDVSVSLTAAELKPGTEAVLSVTMTLPSGFYTYSTDRSFSGATRITVERAAGLTVIDEEFRPDRPPQRAFEPLFDEHVEKFYDRVTWTRRYRIDEGVRPEDVSIKGRLRGQYCNETQCNLIEPPHDEFHVTLTQGEPPADSAASAADSDSSRFVRSRNRNIAVADTTKLAALIANANR
jgi:hypothetical protein